MSSRLLRQDMLKAKGLGSLRIARPHVPGLTPPWPVKAQTPRTVLSGGQPRTRAHGSRERGLWARLRAVLQACYR